MDVGYQVMGKTIGNFVSMNTCKLILPPSNCDAITLSGQEVCVASGDSKSSLPNLTNKKSVFSGFHLWSL